MKIALLFALVLFSSSIVLAADNSGSNNKIRTGKIIVEVSNFCNDKGVAKLHLFNVAEFFPTQSIKAIARIVTKISNRKVVFEIDNIPYGTYAFTLHHDENHNGKMDKNFLGLPAEGYGFSNNLHPTFSIPDFEEARFEINKSVVFQKVEMN